jgi:RND family efflux transporter MFP subunit
MRSVNVGANVAGRVASVPVRVGDRVEAGAVLASIDAASYRAALAQASGAQNAASANVDVAKAQLLQARARYNLAAVTGRRMASLFAQGAISRQQFDQTEADVATAHAAVTQAQAAVAAAVGSVAQSSGAIAAAQVPLEDATIRAPFSGIVTAKMIDPGAVVGPGAPAFSFEDDRNLEVDLAVPEDAAATLIPGSEVRVHFDALNADVRGSVRAIVPATGSSLHTATVRVALQPRDGLMSGMYARVDLPVKTHNATAVPWSAVITRAGQSGVFAIRDGRATFVPVESSTAIDGLVEVRGIATGESVAVSNLDRLTEGAEVSVQ